MTNPGFLIIDDHPLVLDALQATVLKAFPESEVDVANTLQQAQALLSGRGHYDMVLVDLRMPDAEGRDGFSSIRASLKQQRVIVISATGDQGAIAHAKQLGASAFIHKSASREAIVAALRSVLAGGESFPAMPEDVASGHPTSKTDADLAARVRELTPAQLGVLRLICDGKLNKQIAHELSIGESTVKSHITSILKKLRVHSRTQAVLVMQRIKQQNVHHEYM